MSLLKIFKKKKKKTFLKITFYNAWNSHYKVDETSFENVSH